MSGDERNLVELAAGLRAKALTVEQRERRDWVEARNKAIQENVKAPESGTFGALRKS